MPFPPVKFCSAAPVVLHTLLMMTVESMLWKRPVLKFTKALLLLLSYFGPIFIAFRKSFDT